MIMLTTNEQHIFNAVLSLIIIVGCLAYILVVWVNYQDKKLRQNIASIFLFNLLTIDMANLLFVMPFSICSLNGKWKLGRGWETANAFLGTSFEIASVLALAIISLDRLAAVMKPFVYRARVTRYKATVLTLLTWFQAVVFSVIPIPFGWYVFNARYISCTFKSVTHSVQFEIYMTFFMVCNFLLSLLIIVGTYLYIFRVARTHRRKIAIAIIPRFYINGKVNLETTRQREIRTAGKIFIVIGAFMVCHLPYAGMRIVELSGYDVANVDCTVTVATKWLSYSKSALDPFIYFLLQKKFRKSFVKLFRAAVRPNRISHHDVLKATGSTSHSHHSELKGNIEALSVAVIQCYPRRENNYT